MRYSSLLDLMTCLTPQDDSRQSCCKVQGNRITICSRTGKVIGAPLEIEGKRNVCLAQLRPLTCGHANATSSLFSVDSLSTIKPRVLLNSTSCAGVIQPVHLHWTRCAWAVEIISAIHCTIEGALSLTFAVRDRQISLMLFGLDSIIEVAAVALVLWRLSGVRAAVSKERLACGSIGVLLILLACAAISASAVHLAQHATPESTMPGLIISAVSFFDMLLLSATKSYLGRKLQSQCLASDAKCSLMCSLLSLCLLVGSIAFLLQPRAWWVDAAAALTLSALILKEGIDMLRNALSSHFVVGGCC